MDIEELSNIINDILIDFGPEYEDDIYDFYMDFKFKKEKQTNSDER